MDNCCKQSSPCGSSTDSLIEKIRLEISKTSDEDMVNIKKLTIQASNKSRESTPPPPSCDIDKKISDLECLIKQLQDELNEMYCANKRGNPCEGKYSPTSCNYACEFEEPECPQPDICQPEDEVIIDKINTAIDKTQKSMESASHRYPIILRDIGHVQENQDEETEETELEEDKPTIIINEDESDGKVLIHGVDQNMPTIGQRVSFDWKDNISEMKEESKTIVDKDSITVMIAELRAEINDTIDTLNKK